MNSREICRKSISHIEPVRLVVDFGGRQEEKIELFELNCGSRENGGIWYSLNGPPIHGFSTWNKDAASKLFHRLTLKLQAEQFPQYWSCYWSSFDATEPSIGPGEGFHAQHITWSPGDNQIHILRPHSYLAGLQLD